MTDKTKHLNLEYLSSTSDSLTPDIEQSRFVTLDTQLLSIFKALGNGRVSDASSWNLLTQSDLISRANTEGFTIYYNNNQYYQEDPTDVKSDRFVYLTPGEGVVNSLGVKTQQYIKVGFLPYTINYIYLYTTDTTPLTQVPGITITSVEQDVNNATQLLIGVVTINDDGNTVSYDIDQTRLLEVSTLSLALKDLIQHTHGKDGISKIDLATEVRGLLSSDNISDIDPSRITEGTLNPAIIQLSHLLLKDVGDLSHEEIDSAIELLQQSNKKLFGDLSTSNLLQSIIAIKQSYANVDKYFRNLITIIPGVGNITDLNADTFLDTSSYIVSNTEADDAITHAATLVTSTTKQSDAAIADFGNNEFRGLLATGSSIGELTFDTKAEYELGNYDDDYIDVNSDETYVFGYGFSTDGISFFNVFGVATGTFTAGVPVAYGYPLITGTIGYGYGYQLTAGGDFLPGNVNVTLKSGRTDVSLYQPSNASLSGDFISDDSFYQEVFNVAQELPTFTNDEFYITGLIKTSGTKGSGINIEYFDSILRYEVDTTKTTGFVGDISDYNTLQITFQRDPNNDGYWYRTADLTASPVEITEYTSYEFENDWLLRVTYTDASHVDISIPGMLGPPDSSSDGNTVNSNSIISIPLSSAKNGKIVKRFEILPSVKGTEIKEFFSNNSIVPFGDSDLSSENTYNSSSSTADHKGLTNYYYLDDDENVNKIGSYPLVWSRAIDAIGLTGSVKYSDTDSNNTIDELYAIVTSNPAVDWKTISWIADEPGDSKVVFKLRSVDLNSISDDPYEALADTSFGNPYCNKSGTVEDESFTRRPSGSQITEGADNDDAIPRGTHLEMKVILQPSSDGLLAPTLHSVTIRYATTTSDARIYIAGGEGWNPNLQTEFDRINVRLSSSSTESLEVRHFGDIDNLFVGRDGSFSKHPRQTNQRFLVANTSNIKNISAPPSPFQIINGDNSPNEPVGKLYAVKKLANHDIVIADTENHRVIVLDSSRNYSFKTGIYGSVGISSIARTTKSDGIDKSFSILKAIYNKTEKAIYVIFSHMLDENSFDVSSIQVTSVDNLFNNYTLSGSSSYSATLTNDFNLTLTSENKSHIRIPSGFFIQDQNGASAGIGGSNVIRIKLSDVDANTINNISKPRQINVLVYSQTTGSFLVPVHQSLNPITDGSSTDGVTVDHRIFATLDEQNIYIRPIVNPIDVEVLNDDTLAICSVIGNTGLEEDGTSEFGDFTSFYRTTSTRTVNDVTASSTTHPRIQFYDLSEKDLVVTDSSGNAKSSQGKIDGNDSVVHFSIPYGGSFKEVLSGSTYRYLIADPGNRKIFLTDTDFTTKVWEAVMDDLTPKPGSSSQYIPTCADKDSGSYYVSIVGTGSGIPNDNKILKIAQDLSYQIFLNKELSNPIDISVAGTNRLIIST